MPPAMMTQRRCQNGGLLSGPVPGAVVPVVGVLFDMVVPASRPRGPSSPNVARLAPRDNRPLGTLARLRASALDHLGGTSYSGPRRTGVGVTWRIATRRAPG
jgi:hypothetical protein